MAVQGEAEGDRVEQVEGRDGTPVGRRAVLGMVGLGAIGVVIGAKVQSGVARALRPLTLNDRTGLASLLPGSGTFRIYSVTGSLPSRSTSQWKLRLDGLVDTPLDLNYQQLRALAPTHLTKDFQCVTGWRVSKVAWTGVKLADLLDKAGVRAGATHLRLYSFDGAYTESLTLAQARRDDVLVAYEMLGKPVTHEHGGPVRLYVAPMYGYKSLKWLERIEVVNTLVPGYWEDLGYDVDAFIGQSNGRSDTPVS
ncbi:MAG: oxidoreductase molybdopterin binding [Acidimicrobiales bacterium]|nr:oxidoreductase molybdopterin binding [Acidimicrobiales bacterium]